MKKYLLNTLACESIQNVHRHSKVGIFGHVPSTNSWSLVLRPKPEYLAKDTNANSAKLYILIEDQTAEDLFKGCREKEDAIMDWLQTRRRQHCPESGRIFTNFKEG